MKTRSNLSLCFGVILIFGLASGTALAGTKYVWPDSPSPTPPYDTWATAARTIKEAVDAALPGDTVWVTNGVYATGGRAVYGTLTKRVAIDTAIRVESVNGPGVTVIEGAPRVLEARAGRVARGTSRPKLPFVHILVAQTARRARRQERPGLVARPEDTHRL